jgi:L-seryl-tRNA(Ser) seleniumtransferase
MPANIYDTLGVRRLILAKSWNTPCGGSIMPPEVVKAMSDAVPYYVDMKALNHRAGERIAQVTGAQAGLVCAGAAAGLALMGAAVMTGPDAGAAARLPDTTGMKNEIIIPKCQRNRYCTALKFAGAHVVEAGTANGVTAQDVERLIGPRTAAVLCVESFLLRHAAPLEDIIAVAHKHGLPFLLDASITLPPAGNLTRFIAMGADLVAYSGGKGLRGPQSSGFICGREDLVRAAEMNYLTYDVPEEGLGRPMKVCKEEIIGLLAALDLFLRTDHVAERSAWNKACDAILAAAQGIPGVRAVLEDDDRHPSPVVVVYFEPSWAGPSNKDVADAMLHGDPSIEIALPGPHKDGLWMMPVNLQPGEEHIVARRLREVLTSGASGTQ